jgi:hypothetical protein
MFYLTLFIIFIVDIIIINENRIFKKESMIGFDQIVCH